MTDLIKKVYDTNRARDMEIFSRRLLKLGEEYGEACQAFLSVSSENNGKNKTWADVREELVDVLVVTVDLLCHDLPDEPESNVVSKAKIVTDLLDRKLDKWTKKIKKKQETAPK